MRPASRTLSHLPPSPAPSARRAPQELKGLAATRGERMVRQVSTMVKHNVGQVTRDVATEVEQHLRALQRELQSWAGVNPNLKPYAQGHIGWLLKQARAPRPPGEPRW